MKLYVIYEALGSWEDYRQRPVTVAKTKERADEIIAELNTIPQGHPFDVTDESLAPQRNKFESILQDWYEIEDDLYYNIMHDPKFDDRAYSDMTLEEQLQYKDFNHERDEKIRAIREEFIVKHMNDAGIEFTKQQLEQYDNWVNDGYDIPSYHYWEVEADKSIYFI